MRAALQQLLLKAADAAIRRGLVATRPGRWLYEESYDLYKTLLEAPAVGHLRPLVRPGEWVIDVGANIGFFTRRFASWMQDGRVIAIEPEPGNMASLRAALARARVLDKVDLVEAAAVDREGEARLCINPRNPADHRLGPGGVPVRGVSLDGLVAAQGWPRVGLVKMDIQGAEWCAVEGAREVLARSAPALFIELADEALAPWGVTGADVVRDLAGRGYRAHRLDRRGISPPRPIAEIEHLLAENWYVDVLFLTPERWDERRR